MARRYKLSDEAWGVVSDLFIKPMAKVDCALATG